MNHVPYVVGTDITQLSRWNFASNPVKYARLARRILHPDELHEIWTLKPNVARALFPQVYLEPDGLELSGRRDRLDEFIRVVKRPFHHTVVRRPYQTLLESKTVQRQVATLLGGRWAAKEAAKKAWGAHLIAWHDLRVRFGLNVKPGEVDNQRPGLRIELRPYIEPLMMTKFRSLRTDKRDLAPEDEMWRTASLSISHDGDYAIATVVAQPLEGPIWNALCDRNRSLSLHGASRKLGYGDTSPPKVPGTALANEDNDPSDKEFELAVEQDVVEEGEEDDKPAEVQPEAGYVPWWKLKG